MRGLQSVSLVKLVTWSASWEKGQSEVTLGAVAETLISMEQIRRTNQRRDWSRMQCIVLVLFQLCPAAATSSRFDKVFVFGDSYVDTGNRDPRNATYIANGRVNQNWAPPYGRTHPGVPAGRFSDGKVLTDHLGDYLDLRPRPYRFLHDTSILDGINFAVSGAGVFNNLGYTRTGDQIGQLRRLLPKAAPHLDCSGALILYSISGNDYAAYERANGSSDIAGITAVVLAVVTQVRQDLRELYDMGFRSFAVGKLPPVGCMPFITVTTNFTSCREDYNYVTKLHNSQLVGMVGDALPDADVIFLDLQLAFNEVAYDLSNPDRLKACCSGVQLGALCGDVTEDGQRFTLCRWNSTGNYFWWDEYHPTEAGWDYVFRLFLQDSRYTDGTSLPQFLGVEECTCAQTQ